MTIARQTLALTLTVTFVLARFSPVPAAAEPAPLPLPPKLDESILRGLDFLAHQQAPDGSFSDPAPPPPTAATTATTTTTTTTTPTTTTAPAPAAPIVAPRMETTALALLALLASGNAPDVGRHGLVVRNAINYLLAMIPESGYVGAVKDGKGDGSWMYGQGIVTLALAEAYGVENSRERRLVMRAAIAKLAGVILAAQGVAKSEVHAGGWGAAPDASDSDLWMTGWNALALRACHDAGFNVPKEAVDRAAAYVLKCRNPLDKGFAYMPGAPGQAATTGIGVVALYALLDAPPAKELADATAFLAKNASQASPRYTLYATYFAAQAALHAGDPAWTAVATPSLQALQKSQTPDGGWPASVTPEEPGRVYATATAVLTLSVPYRLLPIYQH